MAGGLDLAWAKGLVAEACSAKDAIEEGRRHASERKWLERKQTALQGHLAWVKALRFEGRRAALDTTTRDGYIAKIEDALAEINRALVREEHDRRTRELREGEKAAFAAMQEADRRLKKRARELLEEALAGESKAYRAYIGAEDAAAIAKRIEEQAYVHIQTEKELEEYRDGKLKELDEKIERARNEIESAKKHGLDTSRSEDELARHIEDRAAARRTYDEIVEHNAARIAAAVADPLGVVVGAKKMAAAECRELVERTVDADLEGLYWRGGNRRLAERALKSHAKPGDDSYVATLNAVDKLTGQIERKSEELVDAVARARRERFSEEAMKALRRTDEELGALRDARAKALGDVPEGTLAKPPAAPVGRGGATVELPPEPTREPSSNVPNIPVPGKLRMPVLNRIVEDRLHVLAWRSGDREALAARLRDFAASTEGRRVRGDLTVEQYVKERLAEADKQVEEIDRLTSAAEAALSRATPDSDPRGYERNLWRLVKAEGDRAAQVDRARTRLEEISGGRGPREACVPAAQDGHDDEAQRALDRALGGGATTDGAEDASQGEIDAAMGRTSDEVDEHRTQVLNEQSELDGGLESVDDALTRHRQEVELEQRELRDSASDVVDTVSRQDLWHRPNAGWERESYAPAATALLERRSEAVASLQAELEKECGRLRNDLQAERDRIEDERLKQARLRRERAERAEREREKLERERGDDEFVGPVTALKRYQEKLDRLAAERREQRRAEREEISRMKAEDASRRGLGHHLRLFGKAAKSSSITLSRTQPKTPAARSSRGSEGYCSMCLKPVSSCSCKHGPYATITKEMAMEKRRQRDALREEGRSRSSGGSGSGRSGSGGKVIPR